MTQSSEKLVEYLAEYPKESESYDAVLRLGAALLLLDERVDDLSAQLPPTPSTPRMSRYIADVFIPDTPETLGGEVRAHVTRCDNRRGWLVEIREVAK